MKFAYHGNYCGPGWTGGRYVAEREATESDFLVEPVDKLDDICRRHDYNIFLAWKLPEKERRKALKNADILFENEIKEAKIPGWSDDAAALAVWMGGPGPKLRINDETPNDVTELPTRNAAAQELGQSLQDRMNEIDSRQENLTIASGLVDWSIPQDTTITDSSMVRKRTHSEVETDTNDNIDEEYVYEDLEPDNPFYQYQVMNSLSNMSDTTQVEGVAPDAKRAKAGSNVMTNQAYQTPISKVTTIERNYFTETKTVSLPLTVYLSMNMLNQKASVPLYIRLNHPYDIFKDNTLTKQSLQTNTTLFRQRGLSNDRATQRRQARSVAGVNYDDSQNYLTNVNQLLPFPTTLIGSTAADTTNATTRFTSSGTIAADKVRFPYQNWYGAMYQYMTTLSTNYKITMLNCNGDQIDNKACFFISEDSYSTGGNTRDNGCFPADLPFPIAKSQTNVKTRFVTSADTRSGHNAESTIIEGTWTPNRFKKDIANDGEIKTWIPTNTAQTVSSGQATGYITADSGFVEMPTFWYEGLGIFGYSEEMGTNLQPCINLKIDLEYIVQFKDLRKNLRYPRSDETTQTILSSRMVYQRPRAEDVEKINFGAIPAGFDV